MAKKKNKIHSFYSFISGLFLLVTTAKLLKALKNEVRNFI